MITDREIEDYIKLCNEKGWRLTVNCPRCLKELGQEIPMVKDGHIWYCRLCKKKVLDEKPQD